GRPAGTATSTPSTTGCTRRCVRSFRRSRRRRHRQSTRQDSWNLTATLLETVREIAATLSMQTPERTFRPHLRFAESSLRSLPSVGDTAHWYGELMRHKTPTGAIPLSQVMT